MNLEAIISFTNNNISYILLTVIVLLLLALAIFININYKLNKMHKRYKKLMTGMDGVNIERLLMGHIDEVRRLSSQVENLTKDNERINSLAVRSIQKVGMIRFSAFEGVGSDLSFALALLDKNNNGIVLSSIFARDSSRTYVKPVVDGKSSYVLGEEEEVALKEALEK